MINLLPVQVERLLSGRAPEEEQLRILTELGKSVSDDLLPDILMAVLQRSFQSVQDLANSIFMQKFPRITNPSVQEKWLASTLRYIFSPYGQDMVKAGLFTNIGKMIVDNRQRWTHLYVWIIHESYQLSRLDLSIELARAIERFLEDLKSSRHCHSMYEAWLRQGLISHATPKSTMLAILESIRRRLVTETDLDLIGYHLRPLLESFDSDIILSAVTNIQHWGRQLSTNENTDDLNDLDRFRDDDIGVLPRSLANLLGINCLLVEPIICWLPSVSDDTRYPGVVEAIFRALDSLCGIRCYAEKLCPFILDTTLTPKAYIAGIDLLANMLTGLVEYQPASELGVITDGYRRIFLAEQELLVDKQIRQTLEVLGRRGTLPNEIRQYAFKRLLESRPPNLLDLLREPIDNVVHDDPIIQAKLSATAVLRVLDFTDVIQQLWKTFPIDHQFHSQLINVLSYLGHRDIVNILLQPAFDTPNLEIRHLARETLQNAGYDMEIGREESRRLLNDLSQEELHTAEALSIAEDRIKDIHRHTHLEQALYEEIRIQGEYMLNALLHTAANMKARGADIALSLAVELTILEELLPEIESLETQLSELSDELSQQVERAESLLDEIVVVEERIGECEQEIQQCHSDIDNYEQKVENCREKIQGLEDEQDRLQGDAPSWDDYSSDSEDDDDSGDGEYQRALDDWEDQLSECANGISRLQDQEEKYQDLISELNSRIRQLESELEDLEESLSQLEDELTASENQIHSYESQQERLVDELDDLRDQFTTCESGVIDLEEDFQTVSSDANSSIDQIRTERQQSDDQLDEISQNIRRYSASLNVESQNMETSRHQLAAVSQRIPVEREQFDTVGDRVLEKSFTADHSAVDTSQQLAIQQYERDLEKWHLDMAFRNTIAAEPFERQYGESIRRVRQQINERILQ